MKEVNGQELIEKMFDVWPWNRDKIRKEFLEVK
jgi:hypothetical protein